MDSQRISAVIDGQIKHLCQCHTYNCQAVQERDPRTGEPVYGRWLTHKPWYIHRKADRRIASLQTRISLASDAGPLDGMSVDDSGMLWLNFFPCHKL